MNIAGSGALGALSAEIIINGDGAFTVALDLRGTLNLTVEVAGSVGGTNWTLLAVRSMWGGAYFSPSAVFTSAKEMYLKFVCRSSFWSSIITSRPSG